MNPEIIQTFYNLHAKYSDNSYMLTKLENYIFNLPKILDHIDQEYKKKCIKNLELDKEKQEFITSFLTNHLYYYIPQTEIYIEYTNEHYQIISEDDITHTIFIELNQNKSLSNCKYRLTNKLFRLIKERLFIHSTPNHSTIQTILKYLTKYFNSKQHTKYFLTIIGDVLLSKKNNLIFFIDHSYKQLITHLYHHIYLNINKSINDLFKHKYHEHTYELCRIIYGTTNKSIDINFIKENIFNIIAVCCYYSSYYKHSEFFLERCNNPIFINKVNLLKTNTPKTIIQSFIEYSLFPSANTIIVYKDMYYLWKTYLKLNHLPSVISQNNFKSILQEMNIYDEANDKCIGYNSKFPTYWNNFTLFWKQYVKSSNDNDDYYNINNFVKLYNDWCDNKLLCINTDIFKELIKIYYPAVSIQNDNYITNIILE